MYRTILHQSLGVLTAKFYRHPLITTWLTTRVLCYFYVISTILPTGAISMAVDEINEKLMAPMGHSLDFTIAETYGQEEVSIRQVNPRYF